MSTETPPSPDMAKKVKKHKKHKGHTDNNTKKRRREEDAELVPDSQPHERPAKKQKKHKDKHHSSRKTKTPDDFLDTASPFIRQTTSFYLPLSPCAYDFPLEGLCAEHISPLLLTYYPPLEGVVLSYDKPRMSEHPSEGEQVNSSNEANTVLSQSIDEYAVTYVWLTAEFLMFKPRRGTYLEGYVSLQNESMLGLVCYNYFNAVIEQEKLPKDWRWESKENEGEAENGSEKSKGKKKKEHRPIAEGGGYFVNVEREKVEGRLVFRVEDFEATPGSDTGAGTISILGTLLPPSDET